MLRLCDKEVCCVMEEELDRQQLITYFLNGNRTQTVCILDKAGRFAGSITYDSLLGKDLQDAVSKEYIVLNEDIWESGRKYFRDGQKQFGGVKLLPVLDKEHRMVCFAWQDEEANRELRMLDELTECKNALEFKDVYPEADGVTVHGCNELAYYFVRYLQKSGVIVNVTGALWENLGVLNEISIDEQVPDYRRFTVYAEGTGCQEEKADQRVSVSAEFECIDRIYEENIGKGMIKDTEGDFQDMLERLRGRQIVITGIEDELLNVYDLLLENGIDICCFVSDKMEEQGKVLFGKEVLKKTEAMDRYQHAAFAEAGSKYSAWGFGGADSFHYLGYKRNRDFFLIQDYVEIPKNGLRNIIRHIIKQNEKRLVLAGDMWLCLKLYRALELQQRDSKYKRLVYCDVLEEYNEEKAEMPQICADEICEMDICLLLESEHYGCYLDDATMIRYRDEKNKEYLQQLKKTKIIDIVNYAAENKIFMDMEKNLVYDTEAGLKIGKIIIGAINYHSGNLFFRGLLDSHPNIIMMNDNYLSRNLFFICNELSVVNKSDILKVFWKLNLVGNYRGSWEPAADEKLRFNASLEELLKAKDTFTSQEFFIMIHIAYARMLGEKVQDNMNTVIFWEPHFAPREKCEEYAVWLKDAAVSRYIVNVVRNAYIKAGSDLKDYEDKKKLSHAVYDIFYCVLRYPNKEKKEYDGWKRIVLKFEDLKCSPKKELQSFCDEIAIPWSDTLLETTRNGVTSSFNGVTGFDLAPVYRTYEEYFSTFDRFRISLLMGPWQKKYGYPYVNSLDFSRREIQEMFLKEFRFEEKLIFYDQEEQMEWQRWKRALISEYLWMTRRIEITEKNNL